jgi:hypothetical protein
MMIVAVAVFNLLHPGWLLPSAKAKSVSTGGKSISADRLEMNQGPPRAW